MNKTPPLTWLQRSHIAECTAKGLNYLHTTYEKPLVHGDIKSANILLDANMEAKIGDLGLTREGPNHDRTHVKVTSVHGTECYLPDEYLRDKKLSPQVDIYSYGIVMLEVATGLRPFDPQKKRLVDHVKACDDSGRLDSLRDVRAGEENMLWFRELIKIGQVCSSTEKKKRPPMQEVLGQFEKVKTEMSMMDKIRRLSNENTIENPNLSPLELQMIYDFKKGGTSNASENNKMLNISPDHAANSAIPKVIQQMEHFSMVSDENSNESFQGRSSYISSESSTSIESDLSTVSQKLINRGLLPENKVNEGAMSFVRNLEAEPGKAPIPLISALRLPVSQFERNTGETD